MADRKPIDNVMDVVRKALTSENSDAEISADKWATIEKVYNSLSVLAQEQNTVEVDVQPVLDCAYVTIQGSELKIDSDGIGTLAECLSDGKAFFVEPSMFLDKPPMSASVLIKPICNN